MGQARRYLYQAMLLTPVVVAIQCAATTWGPIGVAVAFAFTFAFLVTPATLVLSHRAAGLEVRETLKALSPAFAATVAAVVTGIAAGILAKGMGGSVAVTLAAKTLPSAAVYLWVNSHLGGTGLHDWLTRRTSGESNHDTA
jgi:hypothetical protein